MPGHFEVYEDRAGKYRFRLKAANGQVVAVGEAYETRASAKKGCESVMVAAGVRREALTAAGEPGQAASIRVLDS